MTILSTRPVAVGFTCNITAASNSDTDVQSAITSAAAGQTVCIPGGSAVWNTGVTINKGLILHTLAPLTITGTASPYIQIGSSFPSDQFCRISGQGTGWTFDKVTNTGADSYSIRVNGSNQNGSGQSLTQVRIDHCSFKKGKRAVYFIGFAYGCVDNCTFLNCDIGVAPQGDNTLAWARPIVMGDGNSLFIEDCTFTWDNNSDVGVLNEQIYHFDGARSVTRHCVFDGTAMTQTQDSMFDSHGNDQYFANNTSVDDRGQPAIEFYSNSVAVWGCTRFMHIRGGSCLIHDNTYQYNNGSAPDVFQFSEEESWQTVLFSPLRTTWPAQDQVFNTFIWNNQLNSVSFNTFATTVNPNDQTFIQASRDVWAQAPAASGGGESFTGTRNGGSTTAPTGTDTGSMSFSGSGAQPYFPYTTFTYPHPLRSV